MNIGLVEEDNFAFAQAGAERGGAHVVVFAGGLHDRETRQEAAQIESQVTLGGGFAPTVARPVDAVGDELDRGGVDDVDRAAETPRK